MEIFITSWRQMLSKFFAISLICFASHAQFLNNKWPQHDLITPNGKSISVSWAISDKEQTKGLSNLSPNKMKSNQGLLFFYQNSGKRMFWMPETQFDLDIIFLDKNFKVVAIEENIKHFKKKLPYIDIPRTKVHICRHVLELHAGQARLHTIRVGTILKWKKPHVVTSFLNSLKIK